MSARQERAKEIFLDALEQSGDPQAFVDQACGEDAELRNRVQALLKAHRDAGDFLPNSNLDATMDSDEPAGLDRTTSHQVAGFGPATQVGPYRLLEVIGEGGMGTVWVASQSKPIKRKVALKLVKPGMDSRAVLARFEAERQALAMMDHPNIARVLDGGMTEQGRPYFAMELVHGITITEYCDQSELPIRDRLQLFGQVCSAVQHAHQKGIIHRDLKPSNILVTEHDGQPVVKVIDFGLAKALHGSHMLTDLSLHTSFGAVLGTPLYMAPEQLGVSALDIDTRADTYSLGVILYELLTGTTPIERERLKKATLEEIRRILQDEEPPRPSARLSSSDSLPSQAARRHVTPIKLTRLVRGELDWIIMKALEKDRNRRYESPSSLGQDLERYLDNEPVQAAPPSRIYQLRKLARRHRGPVIAASLIMLSLVGGIIGTSWGLHQARKAAESARLAGIDAEARRVEADKQRSRAEYRENQAIDAVRRFRDAIAENAELKNAPELKDLRMALLKEPLAFFKTLSEELQDSQDTQPLSLARLGWASLDLGELTREIGDKSDALTAFQESLVIQERLVKENPSVPDFQYDLATCHFYIGLLLHETGENELALESHESAIAILERLIAQDSSEVAFQVLLAKAQKNLGSSLQATSDLVGAREAYLSAIEIQTHLSAQDKSNVEFQNNLARCHLNLGVMLSDMGDPVGSRANLETAMEIWNQLITQDSSAIEFHNGLAMVHHNLGIRRRGAGDYVGARASYEAAIKSWERVVDLAPSATEYQRGLALSHYILGTLLYWTKDFKEATSQYHYAMRIQEQLVEDNPTVPMFRGDLATTHTSLGVLLLDTNDLTGARHSHQSAVELLRQLVEQNESIPDFQHSLGGALNNLASVDLRERRFTEGSDHLREAIRWQKKALSVTPGAPAIRSFLKNHYRNLERAANGLEDANLLAEAQQGLAELQASDPRIKALDARLAEVLEGDAPTGNVERIALADRAYQTQHFAAAAGLFAEALDDEPTLADSRQTQHAYNAACAAALAAAGKGIDKLKLDDEAKAELRAQALAWLQAELAIWTKQVELNNKLGFFSGLFAETDLNSISLTLAHWQQDSDLGSLRDVAIDSMPEPERPAWKKLWADVDALLARTRAANSDDAEQTSD